VSLIVVVVFGVASGGWCRSLRTAGERDHGSRVRNGTPRVGNGPAAGVRRCVASVRKGWCRGLYPYDDRRDGSVDVGCRRDRGVPSRLSLANAVIV
jgi:hypothetical protein